MSSLSYAYCIFCDDNNLPRIDARPGQVLVNLELMHEAVAEMRKKYENTAIRWKSALI